MDLTGNFLPAPDARRYEQSSIYWPTLYGMQESLRWLEEEVGWPWVFAQTDGHHRAVPGDAGRAARRHPAHPGTPRPADRLQRGGAGGARPRPRN